MKKEENLEMINLSLAECLIRISALEKLLVSKNVFTQEELTEEVSNLSKSLIETMQNSSGN